MSQQYGVELRQKLSMERLMDLQRISRGFGGLNAESRRILESQFRAADLSR